MVVVIIQLHTDLSDVFHVPDLPAVEIEEKVHQGFAGEVVFVLGEGDEGQDQGVLLLDFVQEDVFAASLSKFVVDEGPGNGGEEKHVEEDEDDEEDEVGFEVFYCGDLVIRVVVVGCEGVSGEDHGAQIGVIVDVGIERIRFHRRRVESQGARSNECEAHDDDGIVKNEYQQIFIGRG